MKGQRIGYVRVSTFDQNVDRQLDGQSLDRIFTDKASGKDINRLREACVDARTAAGEDPATCEDEQPFDHALAIVGMAGRYLASGGTVFAFRECDWKGRCDDIPPPPEPRP